MFFDDVEEIAKIAARNGTSIFVVPESVEVQIPGALVLQPEEKTTITIDQVRKVTAGLGLKQTNDRFVIIRPADMLGIEAANSLLKNLEEPGEKVHYVLITDQPSRLLPTIISRAAIYFWRRGREFCLEIEADEQKKAMAKKLIAAKPRDLVAIAEKITATKKSTRREALDLLALAIEMLYKSFFITGKEVFAKKIPKFLMAYDNIRRNGHIKLHLVADLL
ncbi:MAG: hypothetical protein Q4F56_01500 [Candidatus Saccharibacteria bacterium]|nr:hypothetical protein [Candidatus Saccharibacteria bacterium]